MDVGSDHATGNGDPAGNSARNSFDRIGSVLFVKAAQTEHAVDDDNFGGAVKLVGGPFSGGAVHGDEGNAHKRGLGWQVWNGSDDADFLDEQCQWGGAEFDNVAEHAGGVGVLLGEPTDPKGLDELVVVGEYVGSLRVIVNGGIDSESAEDVASIADGGSGGGDSPGHGLVDLFVAGGKVEGELGGGGIVGDGDDAVVGDLVVGGEEPDSGEAVDEGACSGVEGGSSEDNLLGWRGRGVEEEMGAVNNAALDNVFVDAFGVFRLAALHSGGSVERVVFDGGVDLGGQHAGGGFVAVVAVGEVVQEALVGLYVFAAGDGGVNGAIGPIISSLVAGTSKSDGSSCIYASGENGAEGVGEFKPGGVVVVLEVDAQVSNNSGNGCNSNLRGGGSFGWFLESVFNDLGELGNEWGDPFEAAGLDAVFNVEFSVVGAIDQGV